MAFDSETVRPVSKRRVLVAIGVVVVCVVGLSAWVVLSPADAILGERAVGVMGPISVRVGDEFAVGYGPFEMDEAVEMLSVRPLLRRPLEVVDVRLFVGPASRGVVSLPYRCQPLAFPAGAADGTAGVPGRVVGASLGADQWFYAVAYVRATGVGPFSTEAPVVVRYRQGVFEHEQRFRRGGYVRGDVRRDHASLGAAGCAL